jgi:16S rRNA processing protein RimM
MRKDDCFELGHILKPHGLQGELWIMLDVDFPEDYVELESVFLEQSGNLIPFFIADLQIKGQRALVKFEDVESYDDAAELTGSKLYLPLSILPPLPDDQYYFHELVGMQVEDSVSGNIGIAREIASRAGQDLLIVDKDGKEILIPMVDSILTKVDKKSKVIYVSLPDGLLDLYLSEEN